MFVVTAKIGDLIFQVTGFLLLFSPAPEMLNLYLCFIEKFYLSPSMIVTPALNSSILRDEV
jgi:hypothetical protein